MMENPKTATGKHLTLGSLIVGGLENIPVNYPGLLCDTEIRKYIAIDPFVEGVNNSGMISYGLTSAGYDIRLGYKFRVFSPTFSVVVDPKAFDQKALVDIDVTDQPEKSVLIPPNSYLLGESYETLYIPRDILCVVIGKSTYARCGIIVNCTPMEPEWWGKLTIEISNSSPLPARVYAGEGIAQVLFFRTVGICEVSYADKKGRYQGQSGIVLPTVEKKD